MGYQGKTPVLSSCVNLIQFPAPLQGRTPDLLPNSSSLALPSPNVNVSMHPPNFHPVMYHPTDSQPAPPPAPHSPGLLQHSNPDSNTGLLNPPALLLYTTAAPPGKGPSPTATHPQSCAPYLPSERLSSHYWSLPS